MGGRIAAAIPVGGGCINNGARIETDSERSLFLKWNRDAPPGMFAAEAEGLRALAESSPLRVPEPLAVGSEGGTPWLLMEYVASGATGNDVLTRLGRGLAEMHSSHAEGPFGWELDNWIGSLGQVNDPDASWGVFWRDRRIAPQLALARSRGHAGDTTFDDLLPVIPDALADIEKPDLLHGDLWGGNWFAGAGGEPVLIDPAVYRGHGEVDLAMSELFGGFGPAFYHAYDEIRAITPGYDAYRKALYQLYYLLVHVNLFGSSYEAASLRAARQVLSEVG
jgi:fructosamine-3-kinase